MTLLFAVRLSLAHYWVNLIFSKILWSRRQMKINRICQRFLVRTFRGSDFRRWITLVQSQSIFLQKRVWSKHFIFHWLNYLRWEMITYKPKTKRTAKVSQLLDLLSTLKKRLLKPILQPKCKKNLRKLSRNKSKNKLKNLYLKSL